MKVLLFSSEKEQLELVRETLNDQDYEPVSESDLAVLVGHFEEDPPELIISDFEAPLVS